MEEHDQRDAKRYTEEMVACENVFCFFWRLKNRCVSDMTKTKAVQFLKSRKSEFAMRKKQKWSVCANRLIAKKI